MNKHVIVADGEVYVAIDLIFEIFEQLIATRDQMVADDPANRILVPGSDAVFVTVGKHLANIRMLTIAEADLSGEVNKMVGDIYGFLDEQ